MSQIEQEANGLFKWLQFVAGKGTIVVALISGIVVFILLRGCGSDAFIHSNALCLAGGFLALMVVVGITYFAMLKLHSIHLRKKYTGLTSEEWKRLEEILKYTSKPYHSDIDVPLYVKGMIVFNRDPAGFMGGHSVASSLAEKLYEKGIVPQSHPPKKKILKSVVLAEAAIEITNNNGESDQLRDALQRIEKRYSNATLEIYEGESERGKSAFDLLRKKLDPRNWMLGFMIMEHDIIRELEYILRDLGELVEKVNSAKIRDDERKEITDKIEKFRTRDVKLPTEIIIDFHAGLRLQPHIEWAKEEHERWELLLTLAMQPLEPNPDIAPFVQLEFGIYDFMDGFENRHRLPAVLIRNGKDIQKIAHYWIEDENGEIHGDFPEDRNILPYLLKENERKEFWYPLRIKHTPSPQYTNRVRVCVRLDNDIGKLLHSHFVPLSRVKGVTT